MQFATGRLIYIKKEDFQPGQLVRLGYRNIYTTVPIDLIDNTVIRDLLIAAGIPANDIIITQGFGSSALDAVEIFFAYYHNGITITQDINLSSARYVFGNTQMNGILVSGFAHLNNTAIKDFVAMITSNLPVKSFIVKGFDPPADMIPKILSFNPTNGFVAGMWWIPNTYEYIPMFKALNWQIIQYMTADHQPKSLMRPKTGW